MDMVIRHLSQEALDGVRRRIINGLVISNNIIITIEDREVISIDRIKEGVEEDMIEVEGIMIEGVGLDRGSNIRCRSLHLGRMVYPPSRWSICQEVGGVVVEGEGIKVVLEEVVETEVVGAEEDPQRIMEEHYLMIRLGYQSH